MKNLLTLFSFTFLLGFSADGQQTFFCGYGEAVLPTDVCDFMRVNSFASQRDAEEAVDQIMGRLSLPRYFVLARCPNIENAVAITTTSGDQYIVYDEQFINRIKGNTTDWSALSILAHEIGHHLSDHTLRRAENLTETRKFELEADRFSGARMYKLGASLHQAQQAVRQVASDGDDKYSSHPKLSRRLAAIAEGYNEAKAQGGGGSDEPDPPVVEDLPNMVYVQGGSFNMGSNDGEYNERPVHSVTLSSFYMGIHEVTFDEYDTYCDATGKWRPDDEGWGRGRRPVINVSWHDAVAYCNWRSEQAGLQQVYRISWENVTANWDANGYRLPTEAEWEFGARSRGINEKWAGTSSKSNLSAYGNYDEEEGSTDGYERTAPVGAFRANALGLYDMSGNVWEWCWDWYDINYYGKSSSRNPRGPSWGPTRVFRGGSGDSKPAYLRCIGRNHTSPDVMNNFIGFRLARSAR
jgi:formylglycine-generating enzyme required for sulfatase activity